jgi:hypothetical protein
VLQDKISVTFYFITKRKEANNTQRGNERRAAKDRGALWRKGRGLGRGGG